MQKTRLRPVNVKILTWRMPPLYLLVIQTIGKTSLKQMTFLPSTHIFQSHHLTSSGILDTSLIRAHEYLRNTTSEKMCCTSTTNGRS